MAIRVKCTNPACGKEHNLPAELAGKTFTCDACRKAFQVPVLGKPAGADAPTVKLADKPQPAQPAIPEPSPSSVRSAIRNPQSAMKDPLIGAKIAHYRIQTLLGEGGMGKVYKAHNASLDKTCAIKILPQEFAKQDQTYIDRFVREARSAAAIQHPNVLPVHNVSKVEGHYFIEMDYVDGGMLQGLLKRQGKLPVKEAARIIRDVAAGLQAAHERGIVHRDMKPSNVMLTSKGHVYVMDFGLAKSAQARTGLTVSGTIMGTPTYMSPEQATAQPVDHRTDIYSLGVMFYQILSGAPPYDADSALALISQHIHAPIPDVRQVAPEIPSHIAEMIRKMMAKNPADRYQSCAEIVDELNGFLTTGGATVTVSEEALKDAPDHRKSVLAQAKRGAKPRPPTAPPGAPPKKWPAMPVVLVLVLLFVLGAVAYVAAKGRKRSETTPTAATPAPAVIARSEATKQSHNVAQPPPAVPPAQPAQSVWDDAYVTTATTGDKIPHPLSRKTYKQTLADGATVDVPEGMVYVPAGEFTMGEQESEHEVYLDAYFIGKYEVTNAEWKVFCDFTGFTPLPDHWKKGAIPAGKENHPVVNVSWEDVQKYCEWVTKAAGLAGQASQGRKVALPTEAQWEKAAGWNPKTNRHNEFPWGDDFDPNRANHCWQLGCRCNGDSKIHPPWWEKWYNSREGKKIIALGGNTASIGQFKGDLSAYGCFDMGGNVAEWVADWFRTDYYKKSATRNPTGPTEEQAVNVHDRQKELGACRVCRGGLWYFSRNNLRAYYRYRGIPTHRYYAHIGFRCAIDYPGQASKAPPKAGGAGGEAATPAVAAPATTPSKSPWDDVSVATAATGDKIPHPLSRKTYKQALPDGTTVDAPEGMVYIPAGEFTMGEKESEHQVYLDAYFIGKYEVTNAEWKVFCDFTSFTPLPSHWKGGTIPEGKENHPVVYVSWEDIKKYCEWVSKETGREVKLPTEAQWEKAARGPKAFEYPWGNDWNPDSCNWQGTWVAKYGLEFNPTEGVPSDQWTAFTKSEKYTKEICSEMGGMTMPVGSFPKGKCLYGCYDMAGNAYEWCQDWFMMNYYKLKDARKNPEGPTEEQAEEVVVDTAKGTKGKARLLRGGSWNNFSGNCRPVSRLRHPSAYRYYCNGFRVVLLPPRRP